MKLDDDAIQEFQKLYYKEYGIKLSREQAVDCGTRLVGLVKVVYGDRPSMFDASKRSEYYKTKGS